MKEKKPKKYRFVVTEQARNDNFIEKERKKEKKQRKKERKEKQKV